MNAEIYEIMDEVVSALENAIEEFEGLPHSLGYEFDKLPEYRAKAEKAREFLDNFKPF